MFMITSKDDHGNIVYLRFDPDDFWLGCQTGEIFQSKEEAEDMMDNAKKYVSDCDNGLHNDFKFSLFMQIAKIAEFRPV